jgi:hypothetical protein
MTAPLTPAERAALAATQRHAAIIERHLLEALADYRATRHPISREEVRGLIPALRDARSDYHAARELVLAAECAAIAGEFDGAGRQKEAA